MHSITLSHSPGLAGKLGRSADWVLLGVKQALLDLKGVVCRRRRKKCISSGIFNFSQLICGQDIIRIVKMVLFVTAFGWATWFQLHFLCSSQVENCSQIEKKNFLIVTSDPPPYPPYSTGDPPLEVPAISRSTKHAIFSGACGALRFQLVTG